MVTNRKERLTKHIFTMLVCCFVLLCGCREVSDSQGDRPSDSFAWEERTVEYDGFALSYTDEIWYRTEAFSLSAARLSMALADAAMVKGLHEPGADAKLADLYASLGFTDYESFGYTETPDTDTMAAGFARRAVHGPDGDFTVLAVAARCGSYGREWAGNFTLGEGTEHEGFQRAAQLLYDHASDYCSRMKITGDCVIWTVGFSRAAAVSNLFAAKVARDGGIGTLPARLCAYSFETPAGTREVDCHSDAYCGIFNVIGEEDIVPKMAPAAFGYSRYGTDYVLSSFSDATVRQSVESMYLALYPDAAPLSLSGNAAIAADRFVAYLCDWVGTREQYTEQYQEKMRSLVTALADEGYSTSGSIAMMRSLVSTLQNTVDSYRSGTLSLEKARLHADVAIRQFLKSAGLTEQEAVLDDALRIVFDADADTGHDVLLKSLIFALSNSPLSSNETAPDGLYAPAPAVLSFLPELNTALSAHLPHLCMARLMAL